MPFDAMKKSWIIYIQFMSTSGTGKKVITKEDRNETYLKDTVRRIVSAICNTGDELRWAFPQIKTSFVAR